MIGTNTGTISNVHIVNGRRSGSEIENGALGGMVGFNNGGTIERSSYSGNVNTSSQVYNAGGLVGLNVNGTIRDSSSQGRLTTTPATAPTSPISVDLSASTGMA